MFTFYNNNTYQGKNHNRVLENTNYNFEALQRARQDLAGEIEAVMGYDGHVRSTTDPIAKATWENIRNEELTHIGELLGLLNYLDPSQKQFVEKGLSEFNEGMKR